MKCQERESFMNRFAITFCMTLLTALTAAEHHLPSPDASTNLHPL